MAFAYIATKLVIRFIQKALAYTTTVNGTGVYTGDLEGPIQITVNSTVTNTSTIAFTLDTSTDNSSWTSNVTTLLEDPTTGASASFTTATSAVAVAQTLVIPKTVCPPYIRITATAGGSNTATVCIFVTAFSKFN